MAGEQFQKEMLKLWKSSWESYLKTMDAASDQGEKMLEMMMSQGEQVREEFKKSLKEWAENAKELQKQYRDAVEGNLKKIEEMLGKE